jgi:hypothetical protein
MELGIYKGMSYEQYAAIDAVSSMYIRNYGCPLRLNHRIHNPIRPTEAMEFGRAWHTALLEPQKLDEFFFIFEDYPRNTREGKDRWANDSLRAAGRTVIRGQEMCIMASIMHDFKPFADILHGADTEVVLVWERDDILCKARLDLWHPELGVLADLKSCQDVSDDAFAREVRTRQYHLQMEWYRQGLEALGEQVSCIWFFAQEKEAPYICRKFVLASDVWPRSKKVVDRNFELYSRCRATDTWPGYDEPATLALPPWAFGEPEESLLETPSPLG